MDPVEQCELRVSSPSLNALEAHEKWVHPDFASIGNAFLAPELTNLRLAAPSKAIDVELPRKATVVLLLIAVEH